MGFESSVPEFLVGVPAIEQGIEHETLGEPHLFGGLHRPDFPFESVSPFDGGSGENSREEEVILDFELPDASVQR